MSEHLPRLLPCLRAVEASPHRMARSFSGCPARSIALFVLIFFSLSGASVAQDFSKSWADLTLKSLTLREKIAQLVQIRVPGKFVNRHSPEFEDIKDLVRKNNVGGVVLFAGNVYESAILLNELQTISRLPLLVSADFERGASFRISDTTSFPWTMALGAAGSEQFAFDQGYITAQESRALGVHWIFAPVVDVNNNPANPVINIRSFGEDPQLVARLGSAFIRGAKKGGVLTTAKHFPGHGDTATDSHVGLPVIPSDLNRLESLELAPFRSAIEAGVDTVMTAHVAVPKLTGDPEEPATLSAKILTGLLRDSLKFRGLVVTDALEMGGIKNQYWCGMAAVRAIQAGADVLLLPPDAVVAIQEVERAVKRGDISESRINQSVAKILHVKSRLGLQQRRTVSISRIGDIVASPQSEKLAQDIADQSITVVRDKQSLLPLNPAGDLKLFSLVLASDLESSPGSVFQAELRKRFPSLRTAWANARVSPDLLEDIEKAAGRSDVVLCSTLVRLSSGSNNVSIPGTQRPIFQKLLASGKPLIWISFGNPYVLRFAPQIGTYICAFSYSDVSQIAAARALAGEIAVQGRMPVSIPEHARLGDGMQIPKLELVLREEAGAAGIPGAAFAKTRELLQSGVEAGLFAGAQLLVGYKGAVALNWAAGKSAPAAGAPPIAADDALDAGPLSNIIVSTAAMLAAESGELMTEAPVRDYVPEYTGEDIARLRVRDLLSGLSNGTGSSAVYSDALRGLLEEIVSRVSGLPFRQFLARQIFEPLGMKSSSYAPPGHKALVTSARDLGVFAQMLLYRGIYDHRRYFKAKTVAGFTAGNGAWQRPSVLDWTGRLFSSSAYGYSSPEGSSLWIDPSRQLFVVFLTGGSPDPVSAGAIADAREKIHESILEQILPK